MFALMDVLASREEPVSLKEISEKAGLHLSTTHRILNDLASGGFVERAQPGCYRLGMRLLELGNLVKSRLNVRDAALTPMRTLHKLIQQPVNLSLRQGDEIVYVERAYSERSGMQVVRAIGGHAPLHLTSVASCFWPPMTHSASAPMPPAPACKATPRTVLPRWKRWSGSFHAYANTGKPAITRNWNWACAAWPQAFTMTRTSWWPGCPSRHRRGGWKMRG